MQQREARRPFWNWFGVQQLVIIGGFVLGVAAGGSTRVPAFALAVWFIALICAWVLFVKGVHWRPARIGTMFFETKPEIVEHAERLARSVAQVVNRVVGEEVSAVQLGRAPGDATVFLRSGVRKLPRAFHKGCGFGVWHLNEFIEDSFTVPVPEKHYRSLVQRVASKLNESFDTDTEIFRCNGKFKGEEALLVEQKTSKGQMVWSVIRLGADRGGQATHIQTIPCIPRSLTWLDLTGIVPVFFFLLSIVFLPIGIALAAGLLFLRVVVTPEVR